MRALGGETSKDVLRPFVGGSSVRAKQRTHFLIARLGSWHFESSSHNPEVVGSNPAPATSQNTRNHLISGVFLHFLGLNAKARFRD